VISFHGECGRGPRSPGLLGSRPTQASSLRSGKVVEDRDPGRGPRSGARTEIRGSRSRGGGGWGIRDNGRNGNHLPGVVEEGSTGSSRPPARAAAAGFGVNRKNPKP
jgi:hypothetical protein